MNKVFIVEGNIDIPLTNKKIDFIVSVIEMTIDSVADAISKNQELYPELVGQGPVEYIVTKVEELIVH